MPRHVSPHQRYYQVMIDMKHAGLFIITVKLHIGLTLR